MKKILFIIFYFLFSFSSAKAEDPISLTFELINHNRKLNNLNELTWNKNLSEAAQSHSNWMAKVGKMTHIQGEHPKSFYELKTCSHHPVNRIINSGYYSFEKIFFVEENPNFVNVKEIKNIDDVWGEIVARGISGDPRYSFNARVCVEGWMNSPGHKAQILKPTFKEMGIAITPVVRNGNTEVFWCVNFGSRDFTSER